jgi:hypothetical protein
MSVSRTISRNASHPFIPDDGLQLILSRFDNMKIQLPGADAGRSLHAVSDTTPLNLHRGPVRYVETEISSLLVEFL